MKKVFVMLLVMMMALSMTGCSSLFSDKSVVKFEEIYTHEDPKGLKYDERQVLINKNFGGALEDMVNTMAYPDTMKYDEQGNMVGMYDYDPETGLAAGWMDLTTGEFVAEEVDLGKPDESMMVSLAGDVILSGVIYGNQGKAVSAYLYALLTTDEDKDVVMDTLANYYGLTMTEKSDKVLCCVQDEAAIEGRFEELAAMYGEVQTDKSATAYAENLKMELGLRNYGVNPFKPTSEAKDPTDIQFDTKQVLTSNGAYSFADASFEKDMKVRTDVIYGYEGKAVAHYIYYEYNTKAAADNLMEHAAGNFYDMPERISDTVIVDRTEGQAMRDLIATYIGYNVMKEDTFEAYVTNVEDSYYLMPYEG